VHNTKTNMRNTGLDPVIPNLGTIWKLVVSFMPWLLYSWGKNLHHTMNRRLVGPPHTQSGHESTEKKSCPRQELNPEPSRTWDSHNTDRATQVLRVECCSQQTMTGHLNGRHLAGETTTQQSQLQPGRPDSGPTLWTLNLNNKKPDCDIHWQGDWIPTQAVCDILSPSKYIQHSYSMW